MMNPMAALPIRHPLVFSYESESPCRPFGLSGTPKSGYRERLVFSRTNRVFRNISSGFRERFGVSGTPHRVFRNDSGYRFGGSGFQERLGVSGTLHRGNGNNLFGVSGTP